MADNTKIEWANATLNYVNGCSVVSPGCTNCYAMKLAGTRLRHHPSRAGLTTEVNGNHVWTGEVRLNEAALLQALKWRKPRRIFWNAHGDLFHENVPDEAIDRLFAVCALTPHHTHMILTKRSDRMRAYLTRPAVEVRIGLEAFDIVLVAINKNKKSTLGMGVMAKATDINPGALVDWPLPNVWLGVSVEDQTRADQRIPDLLASPAAVRWISAEPLLGPVNLLSIPAHGWYAPDTDPNWGGRASALRLDSRGFDWIVVGGESGPGARRMDNAWAQVIVDQCRFAGCAVFVKQLSSGGPSPIRDIEQFPEGLRVREYPNAR